MVALDRLLRPRSIAVLGAQWAANVIEQCQRMGFEGPVWPVHPTRTEIAGLPCFPSLQDLPQPPDAVFLGINRLATIEAVRELAQIGAGGAVCFASGWSESGATDLQAQLVQAAGEFPVLGPNCYGVINYLDGALLWPDQHGGKRVDRGVAILSQSSNIAINLTMQARGLPIAYVGCLGNAAQVGLADLAQAMLEDPRVTALGLYIEGIDSADEFARLCERAVHLGKAVIAVKSGKTDAAVQAAASHTAALAGSGVASSAFLKRCGVAEVSTLDGLLEALKVAHVHGPVVGARLCSVSCSGGEAGLMADRAAQHGVEFPPLSDTQHDGLRASLGPLVSLSNPLDYHTFIWGDVPKTTEVFTQMLDGYDAGFFVLDPPRPDRCDPASFEPALQAIEAAQQATGKPAFPLASLPENFDEARAEALIARGIVPLMGVDAGLEAAAALAPRPSVNGWRPWTVLPHADLCLVDEAQAKARISEAGMSVPRGTTAPTLAALETDGLPPPFALKGLGFAHKSEAGAVRLGVHDPATETEMTGAQGYLLEEMVSDGVAEMIVGLRRDPVYGATLTLGLGGTNAELLDDTLTLILPVGADEIEAALPRLRLWSLLDGWRGRPKADVPALIEALMQLQQMMQDTPSINEIEINPLILREKGAIAVDAVIWEDTE